MRGTERGGWVWLIIELSCLSAVPRTPALESAPLASSGTTGGTLPLVIFSHGLSAMRTVYSGICCDLASHGFLVASIEHGDESAGLCLKRVPSLDNNGLEYQDDWILFRELKEGETEFPLRQRQVHARERERERALDDKEESRRNCILFLHRRFYSNS